MGETHKPGSEMVVALSWDSSTSLNFVNKAEATHTHTLINHRIEKARQDNAQVCDVDGSYLYRKQGL